MNDFPPRGIWSMKWRNVVDTVRSLIAATRGEHEGSDTAVVGQDRERKRIASELHDGLGQALTLIKLTVEDARIRLRSGRADEARELLDTAVARICEAIGEVRQICNEQHPVLLERLGLVASLDSICRGVDERAGNVRVRFESRLQDKDVPDALKTDIFRVAQEALTNALRHGSAGAIEVRLRPADFGLWLTIEDDGIGFDPLSAAVDAQADGGCGLMGMRRRVEAAGGTLVVHSSERGGTLVSAFWSV